MKMKHLVLFALLVASCTGMRHAPVTPPSESVAVSDRLSKN